MSAPPPPPVEPLDWARLTAQVGVPVLAGLVTVGVLLGPGRARPIYAARVYGAVAVGAEQVALQVALVQFDGDLVMPAPPRSVAVSLSREGARMGSWSGQVNDVAEVVVPLAAPWPDEPLSLSVADADGIFAHGDVRAVPPSSPPAEPPRVADRGAGLSIDLPRGGAVPELPERLVVSLRDAAERLVEPPVLTMEIDGGDLSEVPSPRRECDEKHCELSWHFDVVSKSTSTGVTAEVRYAPPGREPITLTQQRWLPLRPGALWLAYDADQVRAAGPRETCFVALHDAYGRRWSTRLPMEVDERGFSAAPLTLPPLEDDVPLTLTLASEPGPAVDLTTAWPLAPSRATVATIPLSPLVDGLPAARDAELRRQNRARRPAFALVLAAAFFELAYLAWRRKQSRDALDRRLREAEVDPQRITTRPAAWWLLILSGALLLAFLILASLALLGTTLPGL